MRLKRKCLNCEKEIPYKPGVVCCSKQCSDIHKTKMYNHPSNGPAMPPLKVENITDEGYVNIVKAVVRCASHDVVKHKPGTRIRYEAEEFFRSEHFANLTGLDGETILRDLGKEHKPDTRGKKATRQVRCIETGVVYPSIAAAGRDCHCNPHSIQDVCAKRRHHVRGLHWEYVEV